MQAFKPRNDERCMAVLLGIGSHLNAANGTNVLAKIAMNAAGKEICFGQCTGRVENYIPVGRRCADGLCTLPPGPMRNRPATPNKMPPANVAFSVPVKYFSNFRRVTFTAPPFYRNVASPLRSTGTTRIACG